MNGDFRMRNLIGLAERYVREAMRHDCTGHDHLHVERVRAAALRILREEGVQAAAELIELASLLHDIGDVKFTEGAPGPHPTAGELVREWGGGEKCARQVDSVIAGVGFKGGFNAPPTSVEAKIVQDADRLDALGAIGIARAFAYGGHRGQKIFDPAMPVRSFADEDEYKRCTGTTVNHFHEKLFRLADSLHTDTAKRMAESRVRFMRDFLGRLDEECGRFREGGDRG